MKKFSLYLFGLVNCIHCQTFLVSCDPKVHVILAPETNVTIERSQDVIVFVGFEVFAGVGMNVFSEEFDCAIPEQGIVGDCNAERTNCLIAATNRKGEQLQGCRCTVPALTPLGSYALSLSFTDSQNADLLNQIYTVWVDVIPHIKHFASSSSIEVLSNSGKVSNLYSYTVNLESDDRKGKVHYEFSGFPDKVTPFIVGGEDDFLQITYDKSELLVGCQGTILGRFKGSLALEFTTSSIISSEILDTYTNQVEFICNIIPGTVEESISSDDLSSVQGSDYMLFNVAQSFLGLPKMIQSKSKRIDIMETTTGSCADLSDTESPLCPEVITAMVVSTDTPSITLPYCVDTEPITVPIYIPTTGPSIPTLPPNWTEPTTTETTITTTHSNEDQSPIAWIVGAAGAGVVGLGLAGAGIYYLTAFMGLGSVGSTEAAVSAAAQESEPCNDGESDDWPESASSNSLPDDIQSLACIDEDGGFWSPNEIDLEYEKALGV